MMPIQAAHLSQVQDEDIFELNEGFTFCSTAPNEFSEAKMAEESASIRSQAIVPGTVAMHFDAPDKLSEIDNRDHWYHLAFPPPQKTYQQILLQFDGLLTYAEVYLNGQRVLDSFSAYHTHAVDVTNRLKASNQLWICFRATRPFLTAKQPRARYMTRLMSERHLRFLRTPVLGYTLGFSSPTKLVGPYRPIKLVCSNRFHLLSAGVETTLIGDCLGRAEVNVQLTSLGVFCESAKLMLWDDDLGQALNHIPLFIKKNDQNRYVLKGELESTIEAYWPHTHGQPKRYRFEVEFGGGEKISLGYYGFRRIERVEGESFRLNFNGIPIFFRGACWTPMNPVRLYNDVDELRERLILLRDSGFNMLRIPGNMLYETDAFYALCDELGILVFQDFAFTNFDYPETEEFLNSVEREVTQFLDKHGNRPSLTVLCGGSEVAQQAGMMGVPIKEINHRLFTELLPKITSALTPQVPYVISSPYASKGLPFHVGDGPSTYFGVGGYLRSFEDARLFKGTFITECLPFSHVPEDETLRALWGGEIPPSHHPLWKDGVTRDPGSGWDFSDVTDYYMQKLFGVDPVRVRSVSPERYLAYCRATVVEAVETTMSIFRSSSQSGRAALVWNLHDLKPGAGWGYIDVLGRPKSAFYALKRTFEPTTLLFVDEGLEGLALYVVHDGDKAIQAKLELSLLTEDGQLFDQANVTLDIVPRSLKRLSVDGLLGHFVDSSYAYRFGPRAFVSCVARLMVDDGQIVTQKVYTPVAETTQVGNGHDLTAHAKQLSETEYALTITCATPVYFASLELPGYLLSDNYFHVMPRFDKQVIVSTKNIAQPFHGRIRALNMKSSVAIKLL